MPVSADAGHFDLAADAGSQNTARSIVPWLGHIFVEPVLPRPQVVICGSARSLWPLPIRRSTS